MMLLFDDKVKEAFEEIFDEDVVSSDTEDVEQICCHEGTFDISSYYITMDN
jgi:hypothetical protein